MAENRVEILVTSRNDTKAGFDAAKRDAENAGDAAGQGFARRFTSSLMMRLAGAGGEGGGGAGGATFLETFGSQFGMLAAGALVAAPAIAAVVTEVVALASGFAAATAGAGAFALFAMPTFKQLQGDVQQLTTLYNNLQTAQDKLAIAQGNFSADPTKANKAALTSAQKGLLTAQTNLQAAQMGLGQDAGAAATAVLQLRTEYDKLSASLQPQIFRILGDGLQAVTKFLPALAPMAKAFADALDPLLKRLGEFVQSKGFQDWLTKFDQIIGPATAAIGTGVGKLVVSIGKLFTIMSSHDVVHAINILFDFLSGFFNGLARWIQGAMNNWDRFSGAMKEAWANAKRWTDDFVKFFTTVPGKIVDTLASLAGMLFQLGKNAILGLWHGAESVIGGFLNSAANWGHDIANAIGSVFGIHFSEPSEATQMVKAGQRIPQGLLKGMMSHPVLSGSLGGGGYGGGGGGGVQVVFSGPGAAQFQQLVRVLWPSLQLEVRNRGGGGPKSAQIALGQTH